MSLVPRPMERWPRTSMPTFPILNERWLVQEHSAAALTVPLHHVLRGELGRVAGAVDVAHGEVAAVVPPIVPDVLTGIVDEGGRMTSLHGSWTRCSWG